MLTHRTSREITHAFLSKSQWFHIFHGADHKQVICTGLLKVINWNKLRKHVTPYRYLIGKYFIFVKNAAKIQ